MRVTAADDNTQSGTIARAAAYLDGTDPSLRGMDSPELQKVVMHFGEFGSGYSNSFLNAVPEPTSMLALVTVVPMFARRRRRAVRAS